MDRRTRRAQSQPKQGQPPHYELRFLRSLREKSFSPAKGTSPSTPAKLPSAAIVFAASHWGCCEGRRSLGGPHDQRKRLSGYHTGYVDHGDGRKRQRAHGNVGEGQAHLEVALRSRGDSDNAAGRE